MAKIIQIAAVQARRKARRADDLAMRIEHLREESERRGFTALSYFLDIAVTEALVQARRADQGAGAEVPLSRQPASD